MPEYRYKVQYYFPFDVKMFDVRDTPWVQEDQIFKTDIQAIYQKFLMTAKYYKNKAKNVSKKTRRHKKEIKKFQCLAKQASDEAEMWYENNVEYFI